jgi:phytoene/squalene synthetase
MAANAATPDPDDLQRATRDAMTGRIRARSGDGFDENQLLVERFLEEHGQEAAREGALTYWCAFFEDELAGEEASGQRIVKRLREVVAEHGADTDAIQALIDGGDEDVARCPDFVTT